MKRKLLIGKIKWNVKINVFSEWKKFLNLTDLARSVKPKMNNTKFCSKCKQTKPITDFHKNKSRGDGLSTYCKTCENERGKKNFKMRRRVHPSSSTCPNCGSSKILYRSRRTKDNKCYECDTIIPVQRAGVLL